MNTKEAKAYNRKNGWKLAAAVLLLALAFSGGWCSRDVNVNINDGTTVTDSIVREIILPDSFITVADPVPTKAEKEDSVQVRYIIKYISDTIYKSIDPQIDIPDIDSMKALIAYQRDFLYKSKLRISVFSEVIGSKLFDQRVNVIDQRPEKVINTTTTRTIQVPVNKRSLYVGVGLKAGISGDLPTVFQQTDIPVGLLYTGKKKFAVSATFFPVNRAGMFMYYYRF